ncbi:MAG TPA: hypothetical protein VFX96_16345 [Pyrinomonadaceae bacterium]|nr:hypothetical protein [Pyrinomonadaceae bacterium]
MMRRLSLLGLALVLSQSQTGCVVVGGYSSERGWYIWPGTFVILAVVAVLFLLMRRRGR